MKVFLALKKQIGFSLLSLLLLLVFACNKEKRNITFYYGADLSYVNEMEDCGAVYKDRFGEKKDPYFLFKDAGANLVRLRLWHNPLWTNYSTLKDVKKSIRRAKESKMRVLLDFHYSDDWADPDKQKVPVKWAASVKDTEALKKLVYLYTKETLLDLEKEQLLPDIVQVGNETNIMILQEAEGSMKMVWNRNAVLLNSGIKAVRDVAKETDSQIEVMLHIAQPENGLWWFKQATKQGVLDFDWIGLSYYPKWSKYKLDSLQIPLKQLISTYHKKLMVVETAYPFTLENADKAGNILGKDSLIDGFPPTQQGQLEYLIQLEKEIKKAGGSGLIYWEPAWVSTECSTRWGKGSHWDNATLFDHESKPTLGMNFYNNSFLKNP